jgi:signal transduction histidine kinase
MVGDAPQIKDHVLRNLIENAIYYTTTGSVTVHLSRKDKKLVCTVTDTGVGITPEDMKVLFTEGGHGKDSVRTNVHSTGYGLFIAKEVAEAMNGTIKVESAGEGKGSTFTLEFPAA